MLSFFPRGVLDEILNLIESVSEDFPSYSSITIYNGTPHLKPPKNQNRRAALGRPAIKLLGGGGGGGGGGLNYKLRLFERQFFESIGKFEDGRRSRIFCYIFYAFLTRKVRTSVVRKIGFFERKIQSRIEIFI